MAASNMPVAEVDVDEGMVRGLLASQFPDLAGQRLSLLAHGWDTVVFRLGDDLVVRLPRRQMAADAFANEQAWLGTIAAGLPLPVPVTLRLGRPQGDYPWAWSVCPWIPGQTADVEPPTVRTAEDLGAFVAALHRPAPVDAPRNPYRGVPLQARVDRFEEHVAAVDSTLDAVAVRRRWEAALAVPPHLGPPVWIHGDLHPANLLVHEGRLSGVIDFVDLAAGDPATDLAVAWMLLDGDADRARFRAEAGVVDDDTWARAEGWALAFALAILSSSADNARMAAIGRRTLGALGLP